MHEQGREKQNRSISSPIVSLFKILKDQILEIAQHETIRVGGNPKNNP